jgi:Peptidase family S41
MAAKSYRVAHSISCCRTGFIAVRLPTKASLTPEIIRQSLNTPAAIHPNAMFLRGLQASARVVAAANGVRVGYVHVWSYSGGVYQRALEDQIVDGPLRDADALVWDLRDGWGGAKPQYLDLFNLNAPTMQMTDRSGHITIEDVKWRKPVAMLVNRGTRSGKEVLAYGFKQYHLGEIIGTQTTGAVLAASAFLMDNGDLLLLAVADVTIDCTGPVKYKGEDELQIDIANVKAAAKAAGVSDHHVFLPATAPSGVGINEYYKNDEEYFHALAAELNKEYRAIVAGRHSIAGGRSVSARHLCRARA